MLLGSEISSRSQRSAIALGLPSLRPPSVALYHSRSTRSASMPRPINGLGPLEPGKIVFSTRGVARNSEGKSYGFLPTAGLQSIIIRTEEIPNQGEV